MLLIQCFITISDHQGVGNSTVSKLICCPKLGLNLGSLQPFFDLKGKCLKSLHPYKR